MGIMSVVGGLIGMQIANTSKLIDCIFMCVSAGMLLFIACTEIIVHEFANGKDKFIKLLMVMLGILVIALLWFLHGAAHGGHESSLIFDEGEILNIDTAHDNADGHHQEVTAYDIAEGHHEEVEVEIAKPSGHDHDAHAH
jgi:hypothetical protein